MYSNIRFLWDSPGNDSAAFPRLARGDRKIARKSEKELVGPPFHASRHEKHS